MPGKTIEVAVAVLLRRSGKTPASFHDEFLLARRPESKLYAGYWEFPGGKLEPGESVHEALARELWEELGIAVTQAHPWLTRTFSYPHAHVRLHFWRVAEWEGEIGVTAPLEHSAVCWHALAGPVSVSPLLPANVPILKVLSLPTTMAITHAEANGTTSELQRLEQGLRFGDLCIQLRDRGLAPAARRQWARQVQALAAKYAAAPIFVSEEGSGDGIALAREIDAPGIHLTSKALAGCAARPDFAWVGASCHTAADLLHAQALALDYALLGPVSPTPSHPDAQGLGWDGFAARVENVSLPVFAIGGQNRATNALAQRHGAHGIAALRGQLAYLPAPAPATLFVGSKAIPRFEEIVRCHGADEALCAHLADELEACYAQAGRHYHTGDHLDFMLEQLTPVIGDLADPDAVLFALFYHDVIYAPGRDDNEAQSAAFAASRLERLGLAPRMIQKVRDLILATARHEYADDADTNFLTDIDLAALGVPRPRYLQMAVRIRMEYIAYDEATYVAGRARVLAHFLSLPRIFKTPWFHAHYENTARANLAYERSVLDTWVSRTPL
jgi:8-oxo-dGTP diphosphatase